jgi:hypothetical protein
MTRWDAGKFAKNGKCNSSLPAFWLIYSIILSDFWEIFCRRDTIMSLPTNPPRPLPLWLSVAGSIFAVGHLLVIGIYALAQTSGPWPTPYGTAFPADPPRFASAITMRYTYPYYLEPLRMTHNYHFASNRPTDFAVYFEVQLKNELGDVRTLKFPNEKANFWVRHRQEVLAQNLVPDQRLPPRGNRRLDPVDGNQTPTVEVWVREGESTQRLKHLDENDAKLLDPQVDQPSPWSKALAQSYARYLCREHKAVSATLIRCSRPTVTPTDFYLQPRPGLFGELKSFFGEYRRE